MIRNVASGEKFTYKGITYNKVSLKSESHTTDGNFVFGVSGLEILVLHWTTTIMVDIPMVKLKYINIGQKFRFNSIEYVKVNYTTPESTD